MPTSLITAKGQTTRSNLLVRFLVNDDRRQAEKTAAYIRKAAEEGEVVSSTV